MIRNKKVLCVIPARGGSKGVPGKNIKLLYNLPLIAYSIKAAQNSNIFDEIMVNTDSDEIAQIALRYGASVPFLRPARQASDTAKIMDTYIHTLEYYEKNGVLFDYIMVLLPTAPLRKSEDIQGAFDVLFDKEGTSVLSVCEVDHPPFWMNTLDESRSMVDFISADIRQKNRQELPTYYRINGAIYLAKVEVLKKDRDWYASKPVAYIMPRTRSVDIDTVEDFEYAEFLLKKLKES